MKMTKSDIRIPKEGRNPNSEMEFQGTVALFDSAFGLRISFGIRHSSFGFQP